jgi:predicted DNA-binding transcriptional regulator YafY
MARLPEALAILELHPDGLPLTQLASELGESTEALREMFLAYYRADVLGLPNFRLPVIEFVGSDTEYADPSTAQVVRVVQADPEHELGVQYLSAEQLGALYSAGVDLLALEPDNALLAQALEAFRVGLWTVTAPEGASPGADLAQQLNDAARARRRVHIVYSRAWLPGTAERVIEPYRVIRSRRGWEVDAGPVDDEGRIRTFLVSGIRELQVLDQRFGRPTDVDALISANREPVEVELVVPQTGRWAVDRFAESVRVLQDDEDSVKLRASFLPPVDHRVGLVLICCGPEAFVMSPTGVQDAGADLASQLLEHHGA